MAEQQTSTWHENGSQSGENSEYTEGGWGWGAVRRHWWGRKQDKEQDAQRMGTQKTGTETIVRIKHRKGKKGAPHGGPEACPRSHIIHDIINWTEKWREGKDVLGEAGGGGVGWGAVGMGPSGLTREQGLRKVETMEKTWHRAQS